jgi:hypothetical protein
MSENKKNIVKIRKICENKIRQPIRGLETMGGLVISRDACRASGRGRTTAHITVVSTVLCTGYVVIKTVSCVLMNMILVTII